MAEKGSSTPRRALGPLPDEPGEARVGGRFGSRGLPEDGPSPTSATATGSARGGRFAMSPLSPEDPLDVEGTTPVPPPMPVLPDSEAGLAPAAGRRYSASMEPGEVSSASPRRSAVSPNSPASAIAPILPPVVRPTAPPPVTVPAPTLPPPPRTTAARAEARTTSAVTPFPQSVSTAPTAPTDAPIIATAVTTSSAAASRASGARPTAEPSFFSRSITPPNEASDAGTVTTPKPGRGRAGAAKPGKEPREPRQRRAATPATPADDAPTAATPVARARTAKPAVIVIAAVAVVVLLVAATVWALTLKSTAPSGTASASGTAPAQDALLTTADLANFGGIPWTTSTENPGVRPLCLPALGDGLPEVQRSISRKTVPAAEGADAVIQVVDTYADVAAATQAYDARLIQAGTCADAVALITGANTITGLADSAELVRLTVQEQTAQFHSVLLSRTGRSVSLLDVGTATAVTAPDLANVAALALSRQCGGELGTCPGIISVATSPPPPGTPFGWLIPADLPRITAGAGRWAAPEPRTTLDVVGSQCEALNLKTIPGTLSAAQRTLLLADDTSAPDGFGVDQVVYTFADSGDADSLAKKLDQNLAGCPGRAPTASVKEGAAVKGTGADAAKIAGTTYLVTQKTETNTVVFRVAVVTVDTRVVYLLANPSTSFDFSDADWGRLAVRAGQRSSQSA
ncbi:MAG: hypothetical protein ACOH1Y_01110 [Propionicimonas sp.]